MMVFPSLYKEEKISMTSFVDLLSRFPVGSSAMMMAGSLMSARAMATRCRCPPDISAGI